MNGLKKRLDDAKGKWVEELSHVLWTYQTTLRRSTGETPFSMTYGIEAVIPLETRFQTLRMSSFTPSNNDGLLEKSLDLIEEQRENAMSIGILSIQVQAKVRRQHEVKAISA